MHVKDMVELGRKHPGVLAEFRKGHLLVQKSERKFSLIPKDHSHEQTTKTLKGASDVANIFDRPDTMDVPEKLQVLADFEAAADIVTLLEQRLPCFMVITKKDTSSRLDLPMPSHLS